jgi:hypothetical protein
MYMLCRTWSPTCGDKELRLNAEVELKWFQGPPTTACFLPDSEFSAWSNTLEYNTDACILRHFLLHVYELENSRALDLSASQTKSSR